MNYLTSCYSLLAFFTCLVQICQSFKRVPDEPILLADLISIGNRFKSAQDRQLYLQAQLVDKRQNELQEKLKQQQQQQQQQQHQQQSQQANVQVSSLSSTLAESNNLPVIEPNVNLPQGFIPFQFMLPMMQQFYQIQFEQQQQQQRQQQQHQEQQQQQQSQLHSMQQTSQMPVMMHPLFHDQQNQLNQLPKTSFVEQNMQSQSIFFPHLAHHPHPHHQSNQQMNSLDQMIFSNDISSSASAEKSLASSSLPIFVPMDESDLGTSGENEMSFNGHNHMNQLDQLLLKRNLPSIDGTATVDRAAISNVNQIQTTGSN